MVDAAGPSILELRGVARRFGQRWVLRGADLTLGRGEVTALLGANGSGKTTLLRVAATLLRPMRGTVRIDGFASDGARATARARVGMLGHEAGVYDELTAAENLHFSLRMAGAASAATAITAALEQVGLAAEHDELVRGFSAGMRRRLALARLVLRPPRLLLLDEPYASFDDDGVARVNEFARSVAASGGGVLVATHDVRRGAGTIGAAVRLVDGRIVPHACAAQTEPAGWPGVAVG